MGGIRSYQHYLVIVVLAAWACRPSAHAHMDPEGEVHPDVFVEGDCFAVYFRINRNKPGDSSIFRRVFSPAGKQTKWKQRAEKEPDAKEARTKVRRKDLDDRQYELDPSLQNVDVVEEGKAVASHRLVWRAGQPPVEHCHDYAVAGDKIFVLAIVGNPGGEPTNVLTLFSFDTERFRQVGAIPLGVAAAIYHRPTSSPLLPVEDRLVFAWMGTPTGSSTPQFSLTVVQPDGLAQNTVTLQGAFLWNTRISLAAIGNRVCIAWHDGEAYQEVRKAKIRTLFETIDTSP